jgi:hypothetical protein
MFLGFEFFLSEPDTLLLLLGGSLLGLEFIGLFSLHVIVVDELLLVVLRDQLHRSRAVALVLGVRVGRDTDYTDSVQGSEGVVLELLGHCPWDQVTRGSNATLHVLLDRVLRDVTFETYLNCA